MQHPHQVMHALGVIVEQKDVEVERIAEAQFALVVQMGLQRKSAVAPRQNLTRIDPEPRPSQIQSLVEEQHVIAYIHMPVGINVSGRVVSWEEAEASVARHKSSVPIKGL